MERPGNQVGANALIVSGEDEWASFPLKADRIKVGLLLRQARIIFGRELDIWIIDPKDIWFFPDYVRHDIRTDRITWVLDGKKILVGVPDWEELKQLLEDH